jgi:hypothetical protein
MQLMLHFIAISFFMLTQDLLTLYKLLYLYIFLKSNFNPSGFDISLGSLHN